MEKIVNKHPLAIRWFHWINFPVLTIMIWSGLLIYWANDVYRLGWGDKTLIKFFPQSFYDALNIPFRLSTGMAFHFFFMWFFFLNGVLYVLYTTVSGEWRYLLPNRKSFKEAWLVVLHDLHIRKGLPPQSKYNAAQRIAYSAIVVMGFGSIITGIAIYKPIQLHWLCALLGGYETARIIHFILTLGYVFFFLIHVGQVIIAGWNNFQAMVTGFEVEDEKETPVIIPVVAEESAPVITDSGVAEENVPTTPVVVVHDDIQEITPAIEAKDIQSTERATDEEHVLPDEEINKTEKE